MHDYLKVTYVSKKYGKSNCSILSMQNSLQVEAVCFVDLGYKRVHWSVWVGVVMNKPWSLWTEPCQLDATVLADMSTVELSTKVMNKTSISAKRND